MEEAIWIELGALSAATVALAVVWGFLGNGGPRKGWMGALFMGIAASVACSLCLLGLKWGGWAGLVIGVLLVAVLGGLFGASLGKRRGGYFMAFLWLGYCASCAVGYRWAEGWPGWLTITLPAVALFWYSLWRFSRALLPLRTKRQRLWLPRDLWRRVFGPQFSEEEKRARRHRYLAFRALVTYSMGTNYPYYVTEDGKPDERVGGSPFRQFFAGPGIVITKPHQAAVITDGMRIKEIAPPGLAFTGLFDRVEQIVDLRTQLKAFDVEALTQDGIRVRTLTFVVFKIRSPDLPPGKFWADGTSAKAVLDAMRARPVEDDEQREWDELVPMVATRILQDIISQYHFDKLCARDKPSNLSPGEVPREVIKAKFAGRLREAMEAKCPGIQIIGAGFTNLEPVNEDVMQRCIETWRTEWMCKMMDRMGEGAAEAIRHITRARALGQAEVIRILIREAERMDTADKDILADVLTLRLLEALEELARRPSVEQILPPEATETMKYLRRVMGRSDTTPSQER